MYVYYIYIIYIYIYIYNIYMCNQINPKARQGHLKQDCVNVCI